MGWVEFVHVYQNAVCVHVLVLIRGCCGHVWARQVLSSATELATVWMGRSGAQYAVCWVAWKARVVDRMPCAYVLMPYRAQLE